MRTGPIPLEALKRLSEEYFDTNGDYHESLDDMPNALEFSRLVHIGRPVVIRESPIANPKDGFNWTKEDIAKKMLDSDKKILVAITPSGRADALARHSDGRLYFVEPHVQDMTMANFLDTLSSTGEGPGDGREVHYLQSQDGNVYRHELSGLDQSEFMPLREYIPTHIPWASQALDKTPDAVNLWIGDERSVTSIHSDPYENIYIVVQGTKHFTVLPPTEGWCLKERRYPHARYKRSPATSNLELIPTSDPLVRWSSISDPTLPGALPPEAHPMRLTITAGETLYLPAGWWHYVEQEGFTVAINYWYDVEVMGMAWLWLQSLRGVDEPPMGNVEEEELDKFK